MNTHFSAKFIMTVIATLILVFIISEIVEAQAGHRRRRRRRVAIVVVSTSEQNKQQQQNTQDQQTTSTTSTTTTTPPPSTTQSTDEKLAIGTVVSSLPEGCVSQAVSGVEYYQCGPNYYKEAYQGNDLVYVTTDPPG